MSIRKDEAQLIITIDAKESNDYQKILASSKAGVNDIKKLKAGTDEYNKALNEQARISKELARTDYTKLSLKQIQDRRAVLVQLQKTLPQVTFAEAGFEKELRDVNAALAENAKRTRAVAVAMEQTKPVAQGFFSNLKRSLGSVLAPIAIYEGVKQIGRALIGLGRDAVAAYDQAAKSEAQLRAGIESTEGAAGRSVQQLTEQAAALQKITLFSDDQTQEAQGVLLTFTKVREEIFDRSIPAIQDYATRMKVDLSSAAVQVGKALNDPLKGLTSLSRAGVQFTAQQKEQIKTMVAAGDIVGAQTVILKELETQFKGSAEAAAKAGTGPLQVFYNRIDDIKEGIGKLISNGLGGLAPILDKVATYAEKFVGVLVTGERATGQFAGSVNFLVGLFRIIGNLLAFGKDQVVLWYETMLKGLAVAKELPIIGTIVRVVGASFGFLADAVSNTAAVVAGLKAAFEQAFENAADYIRIAIANIKIFAAEAELALTFDDAEEARLKKRIQLLENQKAYYSRAGKSVAQAYLDGYNESISKEALARSLVKGVEEPGTGKGKVTGGEGTGTGGGTKGETPEQKKAREAEEKRLLKQREERKRVLAFEFFDPEIAGKALGEKMKFLDAQAKRELELERTKYLQGKLDEENYNVERLRIERDGLQTKLELLIAFGAQESDVYAKLYNEYLESDKSLKEQRAKLITEGATEALDIIEQKFADQLISEQEYSLSSVKVLLSDTEMKLQALRDAGLTETQIYKQLLDEKKKLYEEYLKKKKATELTYAEKAEATERRGWDITKELFALGADLLKEDEKARRKHASAIKAFETATVLVNLQQEVSSIWKNANANPTNALLPGWGTAFAIVQSGIAAGRAALAIGKIQAQKFAGSGKVLPHFSGSGIVDIAPNIPIQPNGDSVVATVQPGEVYLNKRHQAMLGGDATFAAIGVPGFANSGVVLPDTRPIGLAGVNLSPQINVSGDPRMDGLIGAIGTLVEVIPAALKNISAKISYNEFKDSVSTVDEIIQISRY